jgi:hypothetical protein
MNPTQQLDQGALARAILTTQRVDLTRLKVKGNVLQRHHSREALGDLSGLEDGRHETVNAGSAGRLLAEASINP